MSPTLDNTYADARLPAGPVIGRAIGNLMFNSIDHRKSGLGCVCALPRGAAVCCTPADDDLSPAIPKLRQRWPRVGRFSDDRGICHQCPALPQKLRAVVRAVL